MSPKNVISKPKINAEVTNTIYNDLFPHRLNKSDKRKIDIIEGAINAYSQLDYNAITFEDIAIHASTNRRLVQHYFPNKDELFELCIKVIRGHMQAIAVEALLKSAEPEDQLHAYIRSTFQWLKLKPAHVRTWILFFLICTQKSKFRKTHSELTKMGEKRIIAIISKINLVKEREPSRLSYLAKTIQKIITGGLMEASTEGSEEDLQLIQEETLKACRTILGLP